MTSEAQILGEVRDMPFSDYLAVDALSNSAMKELKRSPWHFKHRAPKAPTQSMLSGTLLHCAALEPDALSQRYAFAPPDAPRRPTRAQWNAKKPSEDSVAAMRWWSDFNASIMGKIVVTAEEYEVTKAQVAALMAVPELAASFGVGYAETSVFWVDKATGIYCKARPDLVVPMKDGRVVLLDVKTTADESPSGFARTVANFGYHRQDAHYRAGFEAATGKEVAAFIFAAVSAAPPILAVPYYLCDQAAAQGAEEVGELLALLAKCRESDEWPAYGDGYQELELPAYARRNSEIEVSFV